MKSSQHKRRPLRRASGLESLESRQMLTVAITQAIPAENIALGNTASLNLGSYFNDPVVTGTAVEMVTPEGNVPLVLADSQTPKTVANFEYYINNGEYNNTVIHRSSRIPSALLR